MDFDSKNLTIGRGKVLFARYKTGTQIPGPFREFGNCPEFTFSRANSTLDHYSSQWKIRTLDKQIVTDATLTASVSIDDVKAENAAYYFMGEVTIITQTAQTAIEETYEDVFPGAIIQLGVSTSKPTGARAVTSVVVTNGAATPVTYTVNEDYTVDGELGLVTVLEGGAITDTVEITYSTAAMTRKQIETGDDGVEGELKFISFNPTGEQADVTIPRAKLMPNGDLSMLSDPESPDWMTIPLTITALQKGTLALAYRDGRAIS